MKKLLFLLLFIPSVSMASGIYNPGSGSGGGSSSLETMVNGVRVSSPTASQNFIGGTGITISGALAGSATAAITISAAGGSTVLASSGVAFGSPTSTVTSDTNTFTWDNTAKILTSSNVVVTSGTFNGSLNVPFARSSLLPSSENALLYAAAGTGKISSYPGIIAKFSTDALDIFSSPNGDVATGLNVSLTSNLGNPASSFGVQSRLRGGNTSSYAFYADVSGATNDNFAFYAINGNVNIQSLTASQFIKTDTNKTFTSFDLFGSANVWTGVQTTTGVYVSSATLGTDEYANGAYTSISTITWQNGNFQKVTLTANTTFNFIAPAHPTTLTLRILTGAGAFTASWPGTVKWSGGTAPTITATASKNDFVICKYAGDGNYYCSASGTQNF